MFLCIPPCPSHLLSLSPDLLGSGDELYDKLEPLPDSDPSRNHTSSVLLEQAAAMSYLSSTGQRDSVSNLDNVDMTSLDVRGMSRSSSTTSNTRPVQSHPPLMSRETTPSASDLPPPGRRKPASSSSSSTAPSHWSYTGQQYPDHSSASSVANGDQQVGRTDAPVRGSGRRDRNKPERGSGRGHASGGSVLPSISPESTLMNGFATMPHLSSSSYHSDASGHVLAHSTSVTMDTASHGSHGSLENLRLSDSEVNAAFRRDNPGRISITKKSGLCVYVCEYIRACQHLQKGCVFSGICVYDTVVPLGTV